jgi:DNA-directed RNA polymerase specialized sigma24 family protein
MPYYPAAEVVRRLAFLADECPQLVMILIYRIAGRTQREIAKKMGVSQPAIHGRLKRAEKRMLSILDL